MEYWSDLYQELATKIQTKRGKAIKWIDLWHEQINYLTEELPFPVPAIFLAFNAVECNDKGKSGQECNTQVDVYLFFETFSDTYHGSYNQEGAIAFLKELTEIHKILHGTSGTNYSEMRRTGMNREESGEAGNLYRLSFECVVDDTSAGIHYDEQTKPAAEVNMNRETPAVPPVDPSPFYHLDE